MDPRPPRQDNDPETTTANRLPFLGIAYTPLDLPAALRACVTRPAGAPLAYVVTPNADHVVRLNETGAAAGALQAIYRDAWLCVNDSRIVGALARLRGVPLPVCPGADLVARLIGDGHVGADEPVTVIGGTAPMIATLRERYGLRRLYHHDPPFGFEHDPAEMDRCVRFILENPARFILLAVGSPRQERLAAAVVAGGQGTGLALCIGASLEFLTGIKSRAPLWMQRRGLEWLHRLLSEPRRLWRRYLVQSPRVFLIFLRRAVLARE
ncbi:WecB/TagA/CpsF family glycosyltransferase [Roseospira visakhapatnamensis]|uniref:Exopolysaccharide biosynthesis WecB/TagA/CpsF family protein n=1 Tax=Roseospira visakhapatnamensis TaxID=390880 RepID=A0A7W6RBH2_9PROT|nr:WecB/TagA/CpsF family glycosyltransferase [Roseospira visakhapatnamensis]MBB4264884.1 exopolysaccharide biosynthesis WecB/TagA/CpsF family protein [Roseospira visakhapatnamensis]